MKKLRSMILGALSLATLVFALPQPLAARHAPSPPAAQPPAALALSFVPNRGQFAPAVRVAARALGGHAFFTATGIVFRLPSDAPAASRDGSQVGSRPAALTLAFEGAGAGTTIEPLAKQAGVVNYLVGDDPARWRTGVPTYGAVAYRQLYRGIDLHYTGQGDGLKGTYFVAAGADPAQIRWRYDGAQSVSVDAAGRLQIRLADARRALVEQAPVAWQNVAGRRTPVSAHYVVDGAGSIGFALGAYDPSQELVIDPTLVFGTHLGGSGFDRVTDVAVDRSGTVVVVGNTSSRDFPVRNALDGSFDDPCNKQEDDETTQCLDLFVTKLNAAGTALVWSTYFGGTDDDTDANLALDAQGNVYLAGSTRSADFPVRNALQPTITRTDCRYPNDAPCFDLFAAKLNAAGDAIVWSTFLGGSELDRSNAIAVDGAGNVFIGGVTRSSDFPVRNAFDSTFDSGDGFVVKMDAAGRSLLYSTFIGGSTPDDDVQDIAIDQAGNAYLTGYTKSTDFPTRNALQPSCMINQAGNCSDAFVAKLTPSGTSLAFSTYLGSGRNSFNSGFDVGYAIAVDASGAAYVAGYATWTDFPTVAAVQPECSVNGDGACDDAFVAKLNPAGTALLYSTYFGGSNLDQAFDVAVDATGAAYIAGRTQSPDLPIVDALQATCYARFSSCFSAYVTKLSPNGSALRYSTYLGDEDTRADAIAVAGGSAYVVGATGSQFPLRNPIQSLTCPGTNSCNGFVARIADAGPNLSANPSFELDDDGNTRPDTWSTNSRVTRSSALVRSGNYAMRHRGTDNAAYSIYQVVPGLQAGQPYAFRAYANIPATGDSFTFRFDVAWKNAAGAVLRTDTVKTYTAATAGWDRAAATLIAPAGTTEATIRQVVESLNATLYVDDLFFGNYVFNGGFELDANGDTRPDDWSSNGSVTRSSALVRSGSYALRHRATSNPSYQIWQSVYSIVPDTAYRLSGWVNIPATSDSFTFRIEVAWKDSSGTVLRTDTVKQYSAATSGWNEATAALVAPGGAAQATVRQVVSSLNAAIYVDDVVLRP